MFGNYFDICKWTLYILFLSEAVSFGRLSLYIIFSKLLCTLHNCVYIGEGLGRSFGASLFSSVLCIIVHWVLTSVCA